MEHDRELEMLHEKITKLDNLKTDLRPGAVVVTNRAVIPHVVQYNPDLNSLIRAMERQDEEIIGNYGIPKALLSRERTMARATLEFSLRAFYDIRAAQTSTVVLMVSTPSLQALHCPSRKSDLSRIYHPLKS